MLARQLQQGFGALHAWIPAARPATARDPASDQQDPPHPFLPQPGELLALDATRGAGPYQVHQGTQPGRRGHPLEPRRKADLGTRVGPLQTEHRLPADPELHQPAA